MAKHAQVGKNLESRTNAQANPIECEIRLQLTDKACVAEILQERVVPPFTQRPPGITHQPITKRLIAWLVAEQEYGALPGSNELDAFHRSLEPSSTMEGEASSLTGKLFDQNAKTGFTPYQGTRQQSDPIVALRISAVGFSQLGSGP
jgi:hypothetical protein